MATLKICADKTRWILDVTRITEIGQFDTDGKIDLRAEAARTFIEVSNEPFVADFAPGSVRVLILRVSISLSRSVGEKTQVWIVPVDSCFLLGDSGRTIDHF